jgi:ABC-type lipoprotein export system ATPase subunit
MIQLEDVSKIYSTRQSDVRALDSISLSVDQGQYIAICGPSGCGKSTLLSLVGGLALPTSGRIVVAGSEISSASSAERASFRGRNIGFVFQMFHLLPYLNVLENVLLAAPTAGDPDVAQYAGQLLEKLGLEPRRHHRPSQLSAGERQRVAMARALLNRPKLLLADEPIGNLDAENAKIVLDHVTQFHEEGGTVLLVTHEQQATERAGQTIFLDSGKLVEPVNAGDGAHRFLRDGESDA